MGNLLQDIARPLTEVANVARDLAVINVDVQIEVCLDLSYVFDKDTWVTVGYKEHVVHARSQLGKHMSGQQKEALRIKISKALRDCAQSLSSKLPNVGPMLMAQVPSNMQFYKELTETLQEYSESTCWLATFSDNKTLLVSSTFTLDHFLDSLIGRVMLRDDINTDIIDLAAMQGIFAGNFLDLVPDVKSQLLQPLEARHEAVRQPFLSALDFYLREPHWEVRILERGRVRMTSKFTWGDFCQQVLDSISGEEVRQFVADTIWIPITSAAGDSLKFLAAPFIKAVMSALIAKQPRELQHTGDFLGSMKVLIDYPYDDTGVFDVVMHLDFRHAFRQITLRLLDGLPAKDELNDPILKRVQVSLLNPCNGNDPFSAMLELEDTCFPEVVERCIQEQRLTIEQMPVAGPHRIRFLSASTEKEAYHGTAWRCESRISLALKTL